MSTRPKLSKEVVSIPKQEPKDVVFSITQLNKGVFTAVDPREMPDEAIANCVDFDVVYDAIETRAGAKIVTPTKPDSDPVLAVYTFRKSDGTLYTLRFTENKVHKRGVGVWTEITGAGLNGAVTDRITVVSAFNQVIFNNAGVDLPQVINAAFTTYAPLGNAPKYKYFTAFYNRIVGGHFKGGTIDFTQVGWSADGVITEWSPLVNITAGSTPLIESPGDFSDEITGVFGFSDVLVVLRQRSVWLGSKRPSGTNPISFRVAIPDIGCDLPYSAVVIPGGLIWADMRTKQVWVWDLVNPPRGIGDKVRPSGYRQYPVNSSLFQSITDENRTFATYDPTKNKYILNCGSITSITSLQYVYDLTTDAWMIHYRNNLSAMGILLGLSSEVTIGSLAGTIGSFGAAVTIGDLVGSAAIDNKLSFGYSDGEIGIQDELVSNDFNIATPTTKTFWTKLFTNPNSILTYREVRVSFVIDADGPLDVTLGLIGNQGSGGIVSKVVPLTSGAARSILWKGTLRANNLYIQVSFKPAIGAVKSRVRINKLLIKAYRSGDIEE